MRYYFQSNRAQEGPLSGARGKEEKAQEEKEKEECAYALG